MPEFARFLYEVGVLKRIPRSGWLHAGVEAPESVADHVMRTSIIAWLLAQQEKIDTNKAVKMALLHELGETRTGDVNAVQKRYLNKEEAEKTALNDVLEHLPSDLNNEFAGLLEELENQDTREAVVAKDADLLEMYLQAKEYEDIGYSKEIMREWKKIAEKGLKTASAKSLVKEFEKVPYRDWWHFIYE